MDLRVRFRYPVRFVPFRAQNARSAHFAGETVVSLREVPAGDLRPAFTVTAPGNARLATADGAPRLVLSHGGHLWTERGTADALARRFADDDFPKGTAFDACGHLPMVGHPPVLVEAQNHASLMRQYPQPMREYADDGGQAMARRIARRAQDMILVQGKVLVREMEPCWILDGEEIVVGMVSPDRGEPFVDAYREHRFGRAWAADRLDAAIRRGAALREGAAIEVLDPAAVRLCDEGRALVTAAGEAARRMRDHLSSLPADAVMAFLGMRDAFAATRGSEGPSVVAAARVIAALDQDPLIPASRTCAAEARSSQAAAVQSCVEALADWDARPDRGREWWDRGLPVSATSRPAGVVREVLDLDRSGRLARALGADLSDLESAARAGEGRLVQVECVAEGTHESLPVAAVLGVPDGAGGFVAGASVGARGLTVPQLLVDEALAHLRDAALACGVHFQLAALAEPAPHVGGPAR